MKKRVCVCTHALRGLRGTRDIHVSGAGNPKEYLQSTKSTPNQLEQNIYGRVPRVQLIVCVCVRIADGWRAPRLVSLQRSPCVLRVERWRCVRKNKK